jgi:hypothetical protein
VDRATSRPLRGGCQRSGRVERAGAATPWSYVDCA